MNLKIAKAGLYASLGVFGFFVTNTGCAGDCSRQQREREFTIDISEDSIEDFIRVKQIFYSLPSPLETAMLLKSSGAEYIEELLNPAENVSRYMTSRSMALNLGIYATNLSYASLFDQIQTCIDYMDVTRQLADNLGILDAVDSYTIERLEENINNREVILDIVSETFMNSTSFLQENNREPVAAIMLTGGWVEGLYLALEQIDENDLENNSLVRMITDKKLSLEIVMLMLENNRHNDDVADLIEDMEKIESVFREMDVRSSAVAVIQDGDESVAVLRSASASNIDREVFVKLKSTVADLRNSFVS